MRVLGSGRWIVSLVALSTMLSLVMCDTVLGAATTVREPAFGLPHIYADTNLELARENGREVAKDRLGQLILLARAGRGNLYQAFSLLDPGTLSGDVEARRTQYTSSELNNMYAKLPQTTRDLILEYCKGVNDTIDQVYAGSSPEPVEVSVLRNVLGLGADLFGNATNISDQVDPNYLAPGGADPQRPNGGFQFTPETFASIAILQVRQFGNESFGEASRLSELQALEAVHGGSTGEDIWLDLNFLNDPLAPVSVPNATSPGFGGPLAALSTKPATRFAKTAPSTTAASSGAVRIAAAKPAESAAGPMKHGAAAAAPGTEVAVTQQATANNATARRQNWPRYDYAAGVARRAAILEERAELARRLGAWPALGSYSWVIAANKSASANPWLGGFPQTGIQTPSVMHFMENRSAEGVRGIGMEFAGAPAILIGQTDTMAWTSTTAQLRVVDTFLEKIEDGDTDTLMYDAEGSSAALLQRTEVFPGIPSVSRVFWRSHQTNGNGGTRPIVDFLGDAEGKAESGTATELVDNDASFVGGFVGGYVAIVDGTGSGQMREVSAVPLGTTLQVGVSWTTAPDATSVYVAVENGNDMMAVASDYSAWLEETTTAMAFALFQQGADVLDVRAAVRLIPSTHNFPSVDNQTFNGVGTDGGKGNIAYYSSGFSRVRPGGDEDKLLPLDGTDPNPLVVVGGTVDSSTDNTLTASAAFTGQDFSPEAVNFRYDNPLLQGSDYIVTITSGTGFKQTRRIASNDNDTLTLEFDWGVNPANGDTFEIYEIVALPEAVNPSEGYTANWNNKATVSDDGSQFGRNHRTAFILERLATENAWNRDKQRQLNKDVAGLDGKGKYGRYLVPRLRQAFDAACSGDGAIQAIVEALEDHNDDPDCLTLGTSEPCGRTFVDPVSDTTVFGEEIFLESLISQLANDIYGDEFSGAVSVPGGSNGLSLIVHAIDEAAGDVTGSYTQEYSGDYFNASSWESVVCSSLSALAGGGIPADQPRPNRNYNHPLSALFSELSFATTLAGNRGTWEQIVEAGDAVNGEFMFPLGQSGLYEGSIAGISNIGPHVTSLHPLWRDWRFTPMLHVGEDLANGDADGDGDGVWDGFERWYFGDTSRKANDDGDGDKLDLFDEFQGGTDPTDADTDDDGIPDGQDPLGQDRLKSGATKLRGLIKYGDPNEDTLKLTVKFGTGSPEFDPNSNDITVTVSDDDTIYSALIPAGTMVEKKIGRKWIHTDNTGMVVMGLAKAVFSLGKEPGKPAKLVLKTIGLDLTSAEQNDHDVTTEVVVGAHTIPDTRMWEFDTNKLKASK
jgi:hypothetical protein